MNRNSVGKSCPEMDACLTIETPKDTLSWVQGHELLSVRPGPSSEGCIGSWLLRLIQFFCSSAWESSNDGPTAWAPPTHVGDQDGVPNSWFWSGPALAAAAIWGGDQQMEELSLSF